jgi:hypothetical protein
MRVSTGKLFNMVACVVLAWGIGPAVARAQDCGCDVVIAAATTSIDGDTVPRVDGGVGADPGDKICLMAGSTPKRDLFIRDLVGSAEAPILITNCGGQVIIGPESLTPPIDDMYRGIRFIESRHFVLSGKGDPAHRYGIYVRGTGTGMGVNLGGRSEYFRIESLEISHTDFAGIMSKTDPDCNPIANRGNWTQHETYFDDNYIHDTAGEGLYIGSTAYDGYTNKDCNGDGVNDTLYPHAVEGVAITNNRIERTGWDGLQLGSATRDARISGNTIDDFGLEGVYGQTQGIQVGAGTTGWVDRNVIRNGAGNGIFMAGDGENFFVNNLIVRPDGYGIYIGNYGADPGEGFYFYNNTIIEPGNDGIQNFNDDAVGSEAYNNLIVQPNRIVTTSPACISVASNVDWTPSNNICADEAAEVAALMLSADYRPQDGSTAIDAGLDLTADGVTVDLDGISRPQGAAFDVGAYESSGALFQQDFQNCDALTSPTPSSGQFNDISAKADGGTWSCQAGRLQLVREGSGTTENDAGITRHTDFPGPPSVLHITFDLGASAWTASQFQTNALMVHVGRVDGFIEYGSGGAAVNTFQVLSVNGEGPGKFSFATAGVESAHFNTDGAMHRVALFLNKSGAAASYRAPDGTLRSLQANGVALWVGSSPVVVDVAASNGSSSTLTDFRFRWSLPENATWQLDNLVIRDSFPQ